ncbi:hypothetical protein LZK73_13505 [Neorhizobium galegae]|nr:hypothetical protein LZK73_13505 [Neorhizobium galegae]
MVTPLTMATTALRWPMPIITATSTTTAVRKSPRASCCTDYCGVAAITCPGSSLSHPRVVSIREFIDDTDTAGQKPSLHRPPNI